MCKLSKKKNDVINNWNRFNMTLMTVVVTSIIGTKFKRISWYVVVKLATVSRSA